MGYGDFAAILELLRGLSKSKKPSMSGLDDYENTKITPKPCPEHSSPSTKPSSNRNPKP